MNTTLRRIVAGLGVAGAAAALTVTGAATASAQTYKSMALAPGFGDCGPAQYASFAVRGDGWATADGAKFKLLRNGQTVWNTPTRVTSASVQLTSASGTFPGPGMYSLCAQNTGTRNTIATVQLKTDSEV
jgi:hypothetical protein